MIANLIELNEFIGFIEESNEKEQVIEKCYFDNSTIGIAFYGSGSAELKLSAGNKKEILLIKKGLAVSFSGNNRVEIEHKISPDEPLQTISVFSLFSNIKKLPPLPRSYGYRSE